MLDSKTQDALDSIEERIKEICELNATSNITPAQQAKFFQLCFFRECLRLGSLTWTEVLILLLGGQ